MNKLPGHLNKMNFQEGITLLLSILVLSAVLAISFSLATILFVEVRSSGDLLRTETSYYGAQAVTEEALYKFKRQVPSINCGTLLPNCYSATVGAVDLHSIPPFENPVTDPVQQDIVLQGGSLSGDGKSFSVNAKHYTIYNPACPAAGSSGQTPFCNTGGGGYSKIIVTYKESNNTDTLHAYLCQFHPEYGVGTAGGRSYATPPCTDPSSAEYWLSPTAAISSGASQAWTLDPNQQQELILFDPQTTAPIYVQIETFDSSGVPKGIPYFEQTAVDINAQNAGVNRKIRVLIPNSSGISGAGSIAVDGTGGTITHSGGFTIHTFTANDTFNPGASVGAIEVFVVGGGGGGGGYMGGGGGAGGLIDKTNYVVINQNYPVTVGLGGVAGSGPNVGSNGNDSVFDVITAKGGGGGGSGEFGGNGGNGGSGGGSGRKGGGRGGVAGLGNIPSTSPSQGNNGGTGSATGGSDSVGSGAGGGGACSVGGNANVSTGGSGGAGCSNSASGSAQTYAGGGGGGTYQGTAGSGGAGGGGAAANGSGSTAVAGSPNTGGGGGSGGYPISQIGGNGGSGIVIIRYPSP